MPWSDKHPDFEQCAREKIHLIYWTAGKLATWLNQYSNRRQKYTPDELLGSVCITVNECLHKFDAAKGRFSTYLMTASWHRIWHDFIRNESERNRVSYFSRNRADDDKLTVQNYNFHEHGLHLYRVPEPDASWTDDVVGLFSSHDEFWRFITRDLREAEKFVLIEYWRNSSTFEGIAERLHVTKQRAHQRYLSALHGIRIRLKSIEDFAGLFGVHLGEGARPHKREKHDYRPTPF